MTTQTIRGRMQALQLALSGAQQRTNKDLLMGKARQRTEALEKAVSTIDAAYAAMRVLVNAGTVIAPPERGSLPAIAKSALEDARQYTLAAGDDRAENVVASAQAHAKAVEMAAQAAWSLFKESNGPNIIDSELLRLAEPDNPGIVPEYSKAVAALDAVRRVTMPTPEQVKQWQATVKQLNDIADKVSEFADSPTVVAFLKAANSRLGAPLKLLDDPDVQQFLSEGSRSSRFFVIAPQRRA